MGMALRVWAGRAGRPFKQTGEGTAAVLLRRQSQAQPHVHKDAHADTGCHTQLVRRHQLLHLVLAGRQLQTTESEGGAIGEGVGTSAFQGVGERDMCPAATLA